MNHTALRSNTTTENILENHYENVSPVPILAMAIVGLVFSLCFCAVSCNAKEPQKFPLIMGNILFLAASIIAVVYAFHLRLRSAQDYHGKMRVIDVNYRERLERHSSSSSSSSKKTSYKLYYDAVFTVDWGYEWACPDHDAVACEASQVIFYSDLICQASSCSSKSHRKSEAKIRGRAELVFNPNVTYSPYSAELGPSHDIDWPSIVAFGDCNTCKVVMKVMSPNTIQRYGRASLGLISGSAFFVIVWCMMAIRRSK